MNLIIACLVFDKGYSNEYFLIAEILYNEFSNTKLGSKYLIEKNTTFLDNYLSAYNSEHDVPISKKAKETIDQFDISFLHKLEKK